MLSRTDASGSPTRTVLGIWAYELSTSTSTGTASIPTRAKVLSLASTGGRLPVGGHADGRPILGTPGGGVKGLVRESATRARAPRRGLLLPDLPLRRLVVLDQPLDGEPEQ